MRQARCMARVTRSVGPRCQKSSRVQVLNCATALFCFRARAEAHRHAAPLAAVLQDVQKCVDQRKVTDAHVAALAWRMVLNPVEWFTAEFYHRSLPTADK